MKRELEKAKREAEDRWNFDFENERPIEGGRFHWVSGTASHQLLTEQPSTTPPPPIDQQSENSSLSPKPGTHSAGRSFILRAPEYFLFQKSFASVFYSTIFRQPQANTICRVS